MAPLLASSHVQWVQEWVHLGGCYQKPKPTVASPVVGLAPSEKKGCKWYDDTRWPWFAFHTEDDAFKFRVSVALEAKRQSGGKVAVVLGLSRRNTRWLRATVEGAGTDPRGAHVAVPSLREGLWFSGLAPCLD